MKNVLKTNNTHNSDLEEMINVLNGWGSPIVTTNYDTILERYMKNRKSYTSCKEIKPKKEPIKGPYILHLHGSVKKPKSIILTVSDYHKLYHDKNDEYGAQGVLNRLFHDNVILFIGYGLKDYEVLEYTQKHENNMQYFVLEPHTRTDEPTIKPLKSYYKSININMLPYFIDEDGYATVVDVIKKWDSIFKTKSSLPVKKHDAIDQIILSLIHI